MALIQLAAVAGADIALAPFAFFPFLVLVLWSLEAFDAAAAAAAADEYGVVAHEGTHDGPLHCETQMYSPDTSWEPVPGAPCPVAGDAPARAHNARLLGWTVTRWEGREVVGPDQTGCWGCGAGDGWAVVAEDSKRVDYWLVVVALAAQWWWRG